MGKLGPSFVQKISQKWFAIVVGVVLCAAAAALLFPPRWQPKLEPIGILLTSDAGASVRLDVEGHERHASEVEIGDVCWSRLEERILVRAWKSIHVDEPKLRAEILAKSAERAKQGFAKRSAWLKSIAETPIVVLDESRDQAPRE